MKHQQSKLHSKKTSNILHDYRNNLADECNMVEEYDVTLCMKRPPPPCTSNAGSSLSLSRRQNKLAALFGAPLATGALAAPAGAVLPLAARLAVLGGHAHSAYDATGNTLDDLSCTPNDGTSCLASGVNCVPDEVADVVEDPLLFDQLLLRLDGAGQSRRCAERHDQEDLELGRHGQCFSLYEE